MKVYLAGPISGLDFKEATDWRRDVVIALGKDGIKAFSPMRAKDYLADVGILDKLGGVRGTYDHFGSLSTPKGILTRDRFDATRCDMMLVNFLGATRISVGTVMECAWADLRRIPIVCVMEPGNIHEHGMLNEAIGFRVATLDEALHVVRATLL